MSVIDRSAALAVLQQQVLDIANIVEITPSPSIRRNAFLLLKELADLHGTCLLQEAIQAEHLQDVLLGHVTGCQK